MLHLTAETQVGVLVALAILAGTVAVTLATRIRSALLRLAAGWILTIVVSVPLALLFAVAIDGFHPPPTPPGAMGAALLVVGAVFPVGPIAAVIGLFRRP